MGVKQVILTFGMEVEGKGTCTIAKILEVAGDMETITREKFIPKTDGKGKENLLRLINENL